MYAELIQSARNMQAEMEQSMRDAKGALLELKLLLGPISERVRNKCKILRSIGEEDRAAIEEQRLQKFVDDQSKDTKNIVIIPIRAKKPDNFLPRL